MRSRCQQKAGVRGSESAAGTHRGPGDPCVCCGAAGGLQRLRQASAAGVRPQGPCAHGASSWSERGSRHQLEWGWGQCACMPAATGTTAFVPFPNVVCVGADQMMSRWPQVQAEGPCWYCGGTSERGVCVRRVLRVCVYLLETTKLDQPASGRLEDQWSR